MCFDGNVNLIQSLVHVTGRPSCWLKTRMMIIDFNELNIRKRYL